MPVSGLSGYRPASNDAARLLPPLAAQSLGMDHARTTATFTGQPHLYTSHNRFLQPEDNRPCLDVAPLVIHFRAGPLVEDRAA
ncbi:MAG: hypothetical protein PHG00_13795 [Methylococcales bacterium]|nr:hypothetical protein [Methylococcales bacterium]